MKLKEFNAIESIEEARKLVNASFNKGGIEKASDTLTDILSVSLFNGKKPNLILNTRSKRLSLLFSMDKILEHFSGEKLDKDNKGFNIYVVEENTPSSTDVNVSFYFSKGISPSKSVYSMCKDGKFGFNSSMLGDIRVRYVFSQVSGGINQTLLFRNMVSKGKVDYSNINYVDIDPSKDRIGCSFRYVQTANCGSFFLSGFNRNSFGLPEIRNNHLYFMCVVAYMVYTNRPLVTMDDYSGGWIESMIDSFDRDKEFLKFMNVSFKDILLKSLSESQSLLNYSDLNITTNKSRLTSNPNSGNDIMSISISIGDKYYFSDGDEEDFFDEDEDY